MSATDYFLPAAPTSPIYPRGLRCCPRNLASSAPASSAIRSSLTVLVRCTCWTEVDARVQHLATSEEEFWRKIQDDEQGWQLRPLADECQRTGKVLADGQCYAFTTLPILGGDYSAENVWVAPLGEWFSFTSDLFKQVEALPNGSTVSLKVVE
jgi:hypothetical protein